MQTPNDDDFALAVAWLEEYDGDHPEERAKCLRVAKYLERLVQDREVDRQAKLLAKEFNMPVGKIKKRLKQKLKERNGNNAVASNV